MNPFNTLKSAKNFKYFSLKDLENQGVGKISRLPVSIRIVLESVLRNCDGEKIKEEDVRKLAKWSANDPDHHEIPFVVSRVILQDFTGVPLLVDLAAMRDAVAELGADPMLIEPQVPVDLVVDHSVQVDKAGTEDSYMFNLKTEFERNKERYEFLKWGSGAFKTLKIVPPGIGIVHQVNLELIANVVHLKNGIAFPDTLVGTDSHTTMVNGLGVVGWGVGGIEAESAMLGQPVFFQTPEVIGVHMSGKLSPGVTATDLTLRVTELLRKAKVVEKFVEFYGEGAASLSVADRATIGNMSPEYGATMGYFPPDEKTLDYLKMTGRTDEHIAFVKEYLTLQGLFGIPRKGEVDYTKVIELDLSTVKPCVAGPKRPQDRVELPDLKRQFHELLRLPTNEGGYGKGDEKESPKALVKRGGHNHLENGGTSDLSKNGSPLPMDEIEMVINRPITQTVDQPHKVEKEGSEALLTHGSVVIAAITSCTNTSNPSVMLGAGLLAKKAVEKGLKVSPHIKTSLAPGSRVVTDYLTKTGLQDSLNKLGFNLVAYGCTTCIGNSGPLDGDIEEAIKSSDLIAAAVLSGNRNFEARIHGAVKANFLMSPPLVVAFALAGRVDIDLEKEPLGIGKDGKPVYLKEIWPSDEEIRKAIEEGVETSSFKKRYENVEADNPVWKLIKVGKEAKYPWSEKSTYIQKPPYFDGFSENLPEKRALQGMHCLAIFGDSVTTDHISPAGSFKGNTAAGKYLTALGVDEKDYNSYGSRRGNHNVMMRGTFANVRIRNQMAEGKEGGFTKLPDGKIVSIFEASEYYQKEKTPLIVIAGVDYGMGSSRDWAAKGSYLLGVNAVLVKSYERIHRSNLIGMGILPLQFKNGEGPETYHLKGDEIYSLNIGTLTPGQDAELIITNKTQEKRVKVLVRLDTPIEVDYYKHGGIMTYVLRQLMKKS